MTLGREHSRDESVFFQFDVLMFIGYKPLVVLFIVRFLSLFNIRLKDFICILYEFFAMCEVYACVTKHSARVCLHRMCD